MELLVSKMPVTKEDCILYKGKEVYIDGYTISGKRITLYTYLCIDGKACDLNCGKCSKLKVLE